MHALTSRRTNLALWVKAIAVALFAVATAVSARISVPLPFSPVPLTLQVLVVITSGMVLGPRGAFVAQALYLQAILLGAPVTATGIAGPMAFVTPTAGYLLSFPLAAAAAGWLSQRGSTHKWAFRGAAGLVGLAVVYALGASWLSAYVGGLANAWRLGVAPFVVADLLKVVVAATGLSLVRSR